MTQRCECSVGDVAEMRGHVEIAGAGIAGLTCGVALAQRGWTVRIHERADRVRAQGSGIALNKNTQRMMDAIGVLEPAISDLAPMRRSETRRGDGKILGVRDYARRDQLMEQTAGSSTDPRASFTQTIETLEWWPSTIYFVERGRLLNALLKVATAHGVEVVTNSDVVRAEPGGYLETADGTRHHADLIIGADGAYSRVRESLAFPGKRGRMPYGAALSLAPGIPLEDDFYEDGAGVSGEYWTSRRSRFLFFATLSFEQTYIAFQTMATDAIANGRTIRTAKDGKPDLVELNMNSWIESFPALEHMLSRMPEPPIWSPFWQIELPEWTRDNVVLVGDAAHAMAPALGMGGTTAMMDAVSLADRLASADNLKAGLSDWVTRHRPFIDWVQRRSRVFASISHLPVPIKKVILIWGIQHSKWIRKQRFMHTDYVPDGITSESGS